MTKKRIEKLFPKGCSEELKIFFHYHQPLGNLIEEGIAFLDADSGVLKWLSSRPLQNETNQQKLAVSRALLHGFADQVERVCSNYTDGSLISAKVRDAADMYVFLSRNSRSFFLTFRGVQAIPEAKSIRTTITAAFKSL